MYYIYFILYFSIFNKMGMSRLKILYLRINSKCTTYAN